MDELQRLTARVRAVEKLLVEVARKLPAQQRDRLLKSVDTLMQYDEYMASASFDPDEVTEEIALNILRLRQEMAKRF